jgi:hypothetical protein
MAANFKSAFPKTMQPLETSGPDAARPCMERI